MKVKRTEKTITLRGVEFAKGKEVDLSDKPALYRKVIVLDGFEAVKANAKKRK